jgi:8-oxo-dGTP pyrophosphatase MutT (NUDIX family)
MLRCAHAHHLYRRAKARAASSGQTVAELIEDAVRVALRPRRGDESVVAELPVFGGSGVMPGVDLADGGALRELMEEGRAVDAMR